MTLPAFARGRATASDPLPIPPDAAVRPAGRPTGRWRTRLRGAVAEARARVGSVRRRTAPLLAKAARRVRPVTEAVTPLGWTVISGMIACAALGSSRGWLELTTLAVALFLTGTVSALLTLGRWHHVATVEFVDRRVEIGESALGRVAVRNPLGRAIGGTLVQLPVGRNVVGFTVPRLSANAEHEEVFQVQGRRRGVIVVGPVQAVRADPLGLFRRTCSWTDPVELFVHPRTTRMTAPATGFLKDVEGVATQNLSSSDVSFHALRDYVPGDDRRSIHWRTTARVGHLVVRQFEETMRSHLLIVLSLDPYDYSSDEDFELAVSSVGSLGVAALRAGRRTTIVTSSGRLEYASPQGLLDALCRVDRVTGSDSLRRTVAEAARLVPTASVAALVTGDVTAPAELRRAQLALPAQVACVAVRCATVLTAARRKTGSMVVLDVPTLTDLARGMGTLR